MLKDYLVDHALKNVWCTPNQDMQAIVKPARLTPLGGAWMQATVLWRTIKLPEQGPRFHIYQIGQLHPLLMGLLESDRVWTSLADACNGSKLIVDLYSNSGIQMPRAQSWYMVTPEKNLILAVKFQSKIPFDLNTEDLFFRVYSNAYFNSTRSDAVNDFIEVGGGVPKSTDDILALQNRFNTLASLPGVVYAFINGVMSTSLDLFTVQLEDIVEYVYDSSVEQVLDFPVKNLPEFISTLDSKHKYLLHYPGAGDHTIDYLDDNDIFIYKNDAKGRHKGVYYHRNAVDAVRMLTHKDYAIPTAYVSAYTSGPMGWTDVEELVVRLHVRKSGYLRELVDENNRIKELYKLPDAELVGAMVGVNATVSNWTAAVLEDSAYTEIMRSKIRDVSRQMVEDAYGYNAISKLVANTPTIVHDINGAPGVEVPHGLFLNSTAFEYDSNGILKGWNQHTGGGVYFPYDPNASLVEMLVGIGDNFLDETYGEMSQTLDPTAEYRMYVCGLVGGVPDNKWQDVTGSGLYAVINGRLTWLIDPTMQYPMVRSNKRFLAYDLSLPMTDGLLKFSIDQYMTRNGETSRWVAQVPQGEYDFFLNGHSLIEGLDYHMNFPEVCIISKPYLVNPLTDEQKITIRGTGFCKSDLTHETAKDVGFVKYGLLSHNNRFDIRDDKVMRVVVGGGTFDRSVFKYSETDSAVLAPDASNGTPYMLRDIVVPLKGVAVSDTYALRTKAQDIDQHISDYMTQFIPEPVQTTPSAIPARYELFTPFLCKIIYDLRSGVLNDPRMTTDYSDNDVMDICKPYEPLLKYDPTQANQQPDSNFVTVHPHNLSTVLDVNLFQYRFILRVVRVYLTDAVDVSHFLTLST